MRHGAYSVKMKITFQTKSPQATFVPRTTRCRPLNRNSYIEMQMIREAVVEAWRAYTTEFNSFPFNIDSVTSQQTLLSASNFIFLILHFAWQKTQSLRSPVATVSRAFYSTPSSACTYAKNVNGPKEIPLVLSWIPSHSFRPNTLFWASVELSFILRGSFEKLQTTCLQKTYI